MAAGTDTQPYKKSRPRTCCFNWCRGDSEVFSMVSVPSTDIAERTRILTHAGWTPKEIKEVLASLKPRNMRFCSTHLVKPGKHGPLNQYQLFPMQEDPVFLHQGPTLPNKDYVADAKRILFKEPAPAALAAQKVREERLLKRNAAKSPSADDMAKEPALNLPAEEVIASLRVRYDDVTAPRATCWPGLTSIVDL